MATECNDQAKGVLGSLSDFQLYHEMWTRRKKLMVLDIEGKQPHETHGLLQLLGIAVMLWKDDEAWTSYKLWRNENGYAVPSRPATFEDAMHLTFIDITALS